jgi:hypothetical protein
MQGVLSLSVEPKHSRVPEDSKSPTLEVLGFTPTLGQSGVVTKYVAIDEKHVKFSNMFLLNQFNQICINV